MNALLARSDLRGRWRGLAALTAGCFVVLLALTGAYVAYGGQQAWARAFGDHPPKLLGAFAGSAGANIFSPGGFVAFGFDHPLFLLLVLSIGVSWAAAAVAGDVESGRAELLYATPAPRTLVLRTRLTVCLVAEVVAVVAGVMGALAGMRLSGQFDSVSSVAVLRVAVQLLPLVGFGAAIAFTASAVARRRGAAVSAAIGVVAGSYLLNLVALLWSPFAWARRISMFGYYDPTHAITSSVNWSDIGVLLGASAVLVLVARWWVERRDWA